ncbi:MULTISPECIES: hypothetical protein [unclassified Pseudofrankia]|uniref:hypothetical protein n=1 Tax=unclassified Pseudofrankia TaxID=2994372 RepID=UPI0008DB0EF6|nr:MULTISPECIES: hypothetical protein [unclassified Pseudofrankia]MDT3441704.1 hypothetical protein [Pseudofrankia sp. BMG5.37]OHV47156.1 hypothetical protein BCD48_19895 [Pseudofrankia sp. BMG5.36]
MNRILAPLSRRAGTALAVSALALGLATAACTAESTSTDAAAAAANSTAPASAATSADVTAATTPKPADQSVPTASAGGAAFAGGGAKTSCPTNSPGSAYAGVWVANDSKAFLASVTLSFTDCNKLNTGRIRIVSHGWMGLSSNYADWGTAKNVSWGYMGISVTATYYFDGLTEKVRILPGRNGGPITTDGHETYANGGGRDLPTQRYHRY